MTNNPATYRQSCGTRFGIQLHAEHHEQLCGACRQRDDTLALAAEARRPVPESDHGVESPLARLIALVAEVVEDHERDRARAARARREAA